MIILPSCRSAMRIAKRRRRKGVWHLGNLYNKTLPAISDDIREKLQHQGITLTAFEEKNEILRNPSLQQEAGYGKMEDGSYLVSMTCPMPEITSEMIQWWFWWHPHGGIRMPLRIDFVSPEEFGFSLEEMRRNHIPVIVCGHVGVLGGLVWYTEMAHIYRQRTVCSSLAVSGWAGR